VTKELIALTPETDRDKVALGLPPVTPAGHSHHYQPINVLTAGAQAFHMSYPQGARPIAHHASSVQIGG
jgi:hypothetical protein